MLINWKHEVCALRLCESSPQNTDEIRWEFQRTFCAATKSIQILDIANVIDDVPLERIAYVECVV